MRALKSVLTLSYLFVSLIGGPVWAGDSPADQVLDAHGAFEVLKSLEGIWEDEERGNLVDYRISANGSTVTKTYGRGTPSEMFTVIHMDGEDLVLTHYCAIGNQPKMKFEPSRQPGEISFVFDGGTNFDAENDAHAREGKTRVLASDRIETESIGYNHGEPQPPRRSVLRRQAAAE